MIPNIPKLVHGNPLARAKLNRTIAKVNALAQIQGDGFVLVKSTQHGYVLSLNLQKILSMLPNKKGSGSDIHLAYCKTAAGTGSSIVCYLDTDTTGTEITVYCKLYEGGTNLSACAPLLADGDEMKVVQIGGYWRSFTTFIPTDTCS